MPGLERADIAATCITHLQTGSNTVYINGTGACRTYSGDHAGGGLIQGPGAQNIFIENYNASLPGDIILPHAPCPLDPLHCAVTTNIVGSMNVFGATGFADGTVPDETGIVASNLAITVFTITPPTAIANSPPLDVDLMPTVYIAPSPGVLFNYTVVNYGPGDAGPFTVGFYRTPTQNDNPDDIYLNPAGPFNLETEAAALLGATLLNGEVVDGLAAGESHQGVFTLNTDIYWNNLATTFPSYYGVYPDIHQEVGEPNEANWFPSMSFTVT